MPSVGTIFAIAAAAAVGIGGYVLYRTGPQIGSALTGWVDQYVVNPFTSWLNPQSANAAGSGPSETGVSREDYDAWVNSGGERGRNPDTNPENDFVWPTPPNETETVPPNPPVDNSPNTEPPGSQEPAGPPPVIPPAFGSESPGSTPAINTGEQFGPSQNTQLPRPSNEQVNQAIDAIVFFRGFGAQSAESTDIPEPQENYHGPGF